MERCWEAKELASSSVPTVQLLSKDHKPVGSNGVPKTRPTCLASRSPNGELSEWLSDIVEAAIHTRGTGEAISTEDVLAMVDKVVERILQEGYE